jgi:hypothetical protein
MTTKLTLSLDDKIISKAKKIAARKKTSISKLVSNYFEKLPETENKSKINLDDLAGILKKGRHLTDKDIDDIKWEHLKKKHGL